MLALTAALLGAVTSLLDGVLLLTSYVANGSAFPAPLTPEEEAAHLRAMAQGDEQARATLIERNLRLVAHIVNGWCPSDWGRGRQARPAWLS